MGGKKIIEIDIKQIGRSLFNRIWIIILAGVACAGMLLCYAYFFMVPQYSASIKVYVNNTYGTSSPGISSSQIAAAQSLARTYMVILKSRTVLQEVAEVSELPYTYKQLESMVVSTTVHETEVFETTVTCSNYKHAAKIANAIAQVLPDKIAAVVEGSSVRVVDYAVENSTRVSPSYRNYGIIGLVIGVLLSAILVVALDTLDDTIRSEEYLAEAYEDTPLLTVIPDVENHKTYGYYKGHYKGYYVSNEKRQSSKKSGGKS